MGYQTLHDVDWRDKTVLMRVDFNVPIDNGRVVDDRRIKAAVPSIERLLDRGCRVVLLSHLGRPKGKPEDKYSLRPVRDVLLDNLQVDVRPCSLADDARVVDADCPVALLDNLRFDPAEILPDQAADEGRSLSVAEQGAVDDFVGRLAEFGDCYVNDAFGTSHRSNASLVALPQLMRRQGKPCAAGLLVAEEIKQLTRITEHPKRPFVLVLGGAKVSDKLAVIKHLLPKVDRILIGGQMAYTLLAAADRELGQSKVEGGLLGEMRQLLFANRSKIVLPLDHIVVSIDKTGAISGSSITADSDIPSEMIGVDIGSATQKLFAEIIRDAGAVLWNGPLGWIEEGFVQGTEAVARATAKATLLNTESVLGGGDTGAIIDRLGLAGQMTFISTGGGATLKWLEGNGLPALESLA